jgi:protoporphyrinogen IX oxidase
MLEPVAWPSSATLVVAAHVLANMVWIGSLLAVAALAAHAPWTAEPAEVGRLARRVHVRLAIPAFLASFAAGVGRIAMSPSAYARLHWFHAKLTFALAVIVLHHVIGARAKRVANGHNEAGAGVDMIAFVALACAGCAVLLAVAQNF